MIRLFAEKDRAKVKALWAECNLIVPHNDPDEDIDRSQLYANADLFVLELENEIVGSVFVSHDARRGLVYYLGILPSNQGKGYGKSLMQQAEEWIKQQGMNKIHLFVRSTNLKTLEFYAALDYKQSSTLLLEKWI